eukprot:gene9937-biopygen6234
MGGGGVYDIPRAEDCPALSVECQARTEMKKLRDLQHSVLAAHAVFAKLEKGKTVLHKPVKTKRKGPPGGGGGDEVWGPAPGVGSPALGTNLDFARDHLGNPPAPLWEFIKFTHRTRTIPKMQFHKFVSVSLRNTTITIVEIESPGIRHLRRTPRKIIWPAFGRHLAGIWPAFGRHLAGIWLRSRHLSQVLQNLTQGQPYSVCPLPLQLELQRGKIIWPAFGRHLAGIWPAFGRHLASQVLAGTPNRRSGTPTWRSRTPKRRLGTPKRRSGTPQGR